MVPKHPPNDEVEGQPPQYRESRLPLGETLAWYSTLLFDELKKLRALDLYQNRRAIRALITEYYGQIEARHNFEIHHHWQQHATRRTLATQQACQEVLAQALAREQDSMSEMLDTIEDMYEVVMARITVEMQEHRKYSARYVRLVAQQQRLKTYLTEWQQLLST